MNLFQFHSPDMNVVSEDQASSRPARRRKRSVLACRLCHSRKVRCNVTQTGPPCINCMEDGVECEVVAKGRGRSRHRSVDPRLSYVSFHTSPALTETHA